MPRSRFARLARRLRPARRGHGGLVTLEWLLIVGAVGAFASLAVLVVERTVDDEIEVPADPSARLIQADIDAAFVAAAAVRTAVRLAGYCENHDNPNAVYCADPAGYGWCDPRGTPNRNLQHANDYCYNQAIDHTFALRCQRVAEAYDDVLAPVASPLTQPSGINDLLDDYPLPEDHPWVWDWDWDAAAANALENAPEGPAKCVLTPKDPDELAS